MHDPQSTKIPKWPFFLGDAIMLGLACFIYWENKLPLDRWNLVALGVCVALGALLGVLPFILEHRALTRSIETDSLGSAVDKIENLERVAAQISAATSQWESAHQQADKTAATANEIAERITGEAREFKEFMQKMNESEKATLRLEVDKLRRAEADWLQILVRILDHVHALQSAGERSGQPQLVAQLGQFANACRDTARRIGLVPFIAAPGEKFDAQRHKWADGETAADGAAIAETVATGISFQGQLVRPALVRLQENGAQKTEPTELPLEAATPEQGPE